ncbi:MAG TPA: hypothetical protein VMV68_00480 [Spirochaetia bacterium]|nr:hypothetical protein [Spirochaetia bacterium]
MKLGILALVLIFSVLSAAGADELYVSNEIGMNLGPLPAGASAKAGWVLSVSRENEVQTRVLLDNGTVKERWVDTPTPGGGMEEEVYEDGVISQRTELKGGLPVRVEEYSGGTLTGVTESRFIAGALESDKVYDGSGKLLYGDHYARGSDGRLRRVVRSYADGSRDVTALGYAGGQLTSEWLGQGGKGVLYRFGPGGVSSREQWDGTDLKLREVTSPAAGGSESTTRNFSAGTTTSRHFAPNGDLESEVETKAGSVVSSVDYAYAGGRLAAKVTRTPGVREETRYFYGSDGKLERSETTRNRTLVRITHYTGENSYYEDLFSAGQAVLRAYYEKGNKVKEESLLKSAGSGDAAEGGGAVSSEAPPAPTNGAGQ